MSPQDFRFAVRMLRKTPAVTGIAIVALALGIGANTAIFSVVNAVLLRRLPFPQPDRLALIWSPNPSLNLGFKELPPTVPEFLEYQKLTRTFQRLAALRGSAYNLSGTGQPVRVEGARVSGDFFEVLGVRPFLGRTFTREEDEAGKERVAVISYALWRSAFNADPEVAGKTVTLNAVSYQVLGVMPPEFQFPRGSEFPPGYGMPARTDLWTPIAFSQRERDQRSSHSIIALGRMNQGVSLEQASADISSIFNRYAEKYPNETKGWAIWIQGLQDQSTGRIRAGLLVMLGAVGLVLLIACANVANLLLAKATTRRREMAIRMAIGAARGQVIRQLMLESLLLSLVGGAAGLGVAFALIQALLRLAPVEMPRIHETSLDLWVLAFTGALSILTGLLFGLAPALQVSRTKLNDSLKQGGDKGAVGGHQAVRRALVIAEVALAMMLLVGAGLLVRSLLRLEEVDAGFRSLSTVAAVISLPQQRYTKDDQQTEFYRRVLERVSQQPGITHAGLVSSLPLASSENVSGLVVEDYQESADQMLLCDYRVVSGGYFEAMGIELIRGRLLDERDKKGALATVVVNETLVKSYLAGKDPIGRRLSADFPRRKDMPWYTIVGVVRDVHNSALDSAPRPQVYRPLDQDPERDMTLVFQGRGDPRQLTAEVRRQVREVDPEQALGSFRTLAEVKSEHLARRTFLVFLLSVFAGLALILTVVGLYGVISYSVAQRTGEIGIRMALGATTGGVLWSVVRGGMALALIGVTLGAVGALAASGAVRSLLFGVGAQDPWTFTGVAGLLFLVTLAATIVPALRATRIDPVRALHEE